MLPGFSSKHNLKNNYHQNGGKNIKLKKKCNDGRDHDNELNEILLQYNLEKMNEEDDYDFHNCEMHRDAYPFASSISKTIDDHSLFESVHYDASSYDYDSHDEIEEAVKSQDMQFSESVVKINICIYQINTSCEVPFIEYLMTLSENDGNRMFEFPKFDYTVSKQTRVEKQAEKHVLKKLMQNRDADAQDGEEDDNVIKFRGIFKYVSHSKSREKEMNSGVYLFFQKYFKKPKHPPQLSKRDHAWWVVASEIANFKKVMYIDIDPTINEMFIKNPEIMRLYDCKGRLLETPTVCYFGDEFQKIKYLAFFGLLKAPVKSSFGPFYVATNFLSSMKYACYTHNQQPFELYGGDKITIGEHGRYKEGGVLRMILFVGKMKVFLRHGPPDNSQISQELAKTDKTVEKFLSLRDSNGNWTEEYDTAYKGLHFASIDSNVAVNPVEWFFKDYNHSIVISYHNIDTTNLPVKFDVDYADYKLK